MRAAAQTTAQDAADVGTVSTDNHFTMLPDWILEHPDVSDRALRIWLILMSVARAKDVKVAWLGRRRLAELCKCSVDTVDRAIRELEQAGALTVTPRLREDDRSQTSNDYTLRTQPHPCGPPSASARPRPGHGCGPALGMGAAPRERALEGEHLRENSLRSQSGKSAGSETEDSDGSWKPNATHRRSAQRYGLDLDEQLEDFRFTRAYAVERRSDWDKTFGRFLRDVANNLRGQWPDHDEDAVQDALWTSPGQGAA